MPLLTIELLEGHDATVYKELIERCTALYASTSGAPIERFRTVIKPRSAANWGLAGSQGNPTVSPLIKLELMVGRPPELKLGLMADMSALVAEILGIDVSATRMLLREIDPDNWAIGGVPATVARAAEVAARAAAAAAR